MVMAPGFKTLVTLLRAVAPVAVLRDFTEDLTILGWDHTTLTRT